MDRGIAVADKDPRNVNRHPVQRQEEKWWLPTPKVPNTGLSEDTRKKLQYQRECTSQILKAAMAINGSVLSEMEAPEVYLESLPKVRRDVAFGRLSKQKLQSVHRNQVLEGINIYYRP